MTTTRQASKYTVNLVDFTPLNEEAKEFVNQSRGEDEQATACRHSWHLGFIETGKGLFILDNDGVGTNHPITADKPYTLEFYSERTHTTGEGKEATALSMMPSCQMKLSDEDIRGHATGDTKPLDEFIRTFGSRLDDNYCTWERLLDGKEA
jgi:hypothetical protein